MSSFPSDSWLEIRLDAIADLTDKVEECNYFLHLANHENNKQHFRWLLSAFLGAAYSYFETSALRVYQEYFDALSAEAIVNAEALEILRKYVKVTQSSQNPDYVKTQAKHPIVQSLYEYRKEAVHHNPLLLIEVGANLPKDFHIGGVIGKGVPALEFCEKVMSLINNVEAELGWN